MSYTNLRHVIIVKALKLNQNPIYTRSKEVNALEHVAIFTYFFNILI